MTSDSDNRFDNTASRQGTPTRRKRRRLESVKPPQLGRQHFEAKYSDAYRELFNQDVIRAAARFEVDSHWQHYTKQVGASTWSSHEQATFFAALQRLGRANIPAIAAAVGTKSIPETQELLLLLQQAAAKQGNAKVTLRDVPAAIEVDSQCEDVLEVAGEALAWYQDMFEASQEQDKFGDFWLITPELADEIEHAVARRSRPASTPPASEPETPRRGGHMVAGHVQIVCILMNANEPM